MSIAWSKPLDHSFPFSFYPPILFVSSLVSGGWLRAHIVCPVKRSTLYLSFCTLIDLLLDRLFIECLGHFPNAFLFLRATTACPHSHKYAQMEMVFVRNEIVLTFLTLALLAHIESRVLNKCTKLLLNEDDAVQSAAQPLSPSFFQPPSQIFPPQPSGM